jgi:Fe-S cluster biogenesis protein NfuA/nitrite reductase/ring-hydroxylating ferredoxin subunit
VHDHQVSERVAAVEGLLGEVEALPDDHARAKALEVVGALLDLYGEGLERIVSAVAARDDGEIALALADDELVAHLLLLHGLHPVPVEVRVNEALEGVRPYLQSHGGNVELLGVEDGVARLRLVGSCSGCPSSSVTLKLAVENAIRQAAPDLEEIQAEGTSVAADAPTPGLIQLEVLPADPGGSAPQVQTGDAWSMAGGLPELGRGRPVLKQVEGERLLFLKLEDRPYAYRPECPACRASLEDAELQGVELCCAQCASRYDVLRAGRCLDSPQLHLEPVPLLVDDAGLVRVALGAIA